MNWQSETGELLVSDVVEWTEAIWPPKKPRSRKKSRQWGEQKVTAQITEIDGEFIKLTILKSEITENLIGSDLKSYKVVVNPHIRVHLLSYSLAVATV